MKPERIQLSRKKGWRMPANTVKVDRSTCYGNQFKAGERYVLGHAEDSTPIFGTVRDQAHAVELFEEQGDALEIIHREGSKLVGKNLACWCKIGSPCHADVLLRLANSKLLAL